MEINTKLLQRYTAVEVIMIGYYKKHPFSTHEQTAEDLGISLSSVKLHLKKLKADKALKVNRKGIRKVEVLIE